MNKTLKLFLTAGFVASGFLLVSVGLAFANTGTIDSTYKYAWSTTAGWINFAPTDSNGSYIGLTITDTTISGYAWSQNYGWINFGPTGNVTVSNHTGALAGSAWGENAGWIDFSGVTIDSSGNFTGTATGDTVGTVVFTNCGASCGVKTDWTKNTSVSTGGGGTYTPSVVPETPANPGPVPPVNGFKVLLNNGASLTNNLVIEITLDGGADAKQVLISENSDFANAVAQTYETKKTYALPSGEGKKTVYVKFLTDAGVASETISASIILDITPPDIKVTDLKSSYPQGQDVILSGTSNKQAQIIFGWAESYGMITTNANGDWSANFGKVSPGTYNLTIEAKDLAGNKKSTSVTIIVSAVQAVPGKETPATAPKGTGIIPNIGNIIGKVGETVKNLIPGAGVGQKIELVPKMIIIPKTVPAALSGKWSLLNIKPQK